MIKGIEEVAPDLQSVRFTKRHDDVFEYAHIPIVVAGSPQDVATRVSPGTGLRRRKRRRVKPEGSSVMRFVANVDLDSGDPISPPPDPPDLTCGNLEADRERQP